jgi:metal-responsive CopG/Arc/MetJ family transcriptional regulator
VADAPDGKHRVQIDLKPEVLAKLDRITAVSGASSRAEAIRRMITLFDRVAEHGGSLDTVTFIINGERYIFIL